jgi:hypothetical protein
MGISFGPGKSTFERSTGWGSLRHLAAILATPYRNAKAGRVTTLVYAPEVDDADVEVVLAESSAYDNRGIAYEMTFNTDGERYPGWFALPDG